MLDISAARAVMSRMAKDLEAKALILMHENGQVFQSSGYLEEHELPTLAALVAAMIATGRSLGSLSGDAGKPLQRLSCDSDDLGIYLVALSEGHWLAALVEQPLNPGLTRMKVRRCALELDRLKDHSGQRNPSQVPKFVAPTSLVGAKTHPKMTPGTPLTEKITQSEMGFFSNITDDEIDRLFEDARS